MLLQSSMESFETQKLSILKKNTLHLAHYSEEWSWRINTPKIGGDPLQDWLQVSLKLHRLGQNLHEVHVRSPSKNHP